MLKCVEKMTISICIAQGVDKIFQICMNAGLSIALIADRQLIGRNK